MENGVWSSVRFVHTSPVAVATKFMYNIKLCVQVA